MLGVEEIEEFQVWQDLVGCSWEEFVQPVFEAYEKGAKDRNDVFRDEFNRLAGPMGNRNYEGIQKFYEDPLGIFSRILAYEMGRPGQVPDVVSRAVSDGVRHLYVEGLGTAYEMARRKYGDSLVVLDHGAGSCSLGLATADMVPNSRVVLYDFCLPHRQVLGRVMGSRFGNRVTFSWAPRSTDTFYVGLRFNLVYSQEVLEHCVDPFQELRVIHDNMQKGGIMFLSTFFNSCEGHDPSHLDEHAVYQDIPTLVKAIEDCGFKLVGRDMNGCERVWEAL